ncbi:uncharacterized protein LOC142652292 [Rhinoderma darwinii]|uniref:uncharacterized protein LOC142652292 n=1 Tax=Rhinoderma darwinii TaxID=43563 RepID=UPI003F677B5A
MFFSLTPFLALVLYVPTAASPHNLVSDATTMPPSTLTRNVSAELPPADLGVSPTNAVDPRFTPHPTTHQNRVMDSSAFPIKMSEPPPSKRMREITMGQVIQKEDSTPSNTTAEASSSISTIDTHTSSSTFKPHGSTPPPIIQETGFTATLVTTGAKTIFPSTEVTSIPPQRSTNIDDGAHPTADTPSHQGTSQLMGSSSKSTTNPPDISVSTSPSSIALVTSKTTATTMQKTTKWLTNNMPTIISEASISALMAPKMTAPTMMPLRSKVTDPMSSSTTTISIIPNITGTILPAISTTRKTFTEICSKSPATMSAPSPPGMITTTSLSIISTLVPPSVTATVPPPTASTLIPMDMNGTTLVIRTTQTPVRVNETTPTSTASTPIAMNATTPPAMTTPPMPPGRVILSVTLKISPTTNFAVAMRKLLQQTCLLLAQDIPVKDVTLSWAQNKTFLPCGTVGGIAF